MNKKKTNEDIDLKLRLNNIPFIRIEEYLGANEPILFECVNCNTQNKRRPSAVIGNTNKCVVCFNRNRTKTSIQYDNELISKGILDIKRTGEYINNYTPISFSCVNNHTWKTQPNHVLNNNTKCPLCINTSKRLTNEEYDQKLLELNVDFYRVDDYVASNINILHRCIQDHEWYVRPSNALSGRGCPKCSKYGFNPLDPAILYYIQVKDENNIVYFKIGITRNSIEYRFQHDRHKTISTILTKEFERGEDARNLERFVLKNSPNKPVTVPGFLNGGGNTELFDVNIIKWLAVVLDDYSFGKFEETYGNMGTV